MQQVPQANADQEAGDVTGTSYRSVTEEGLVTGLNDKICNGNAKRKSPPDATQQKERVAICAKTLSKFELLPAVLADKVLSLLYITEYRNLAMCSRSMQNMVVDFNSRCTPRVYQVAMPLPPDVKSETPSIVPSTTPAYKQQIDFKLFGPGGNELKIESPKNGIVHCETKYKLTIDSDAWDKLNIEASEYDQQEGCFIEVQCLVIDSIRQRVDLILSTTSSYTVWVAFQIPGKDSPSGSGEKAESAATDTLLSGNLVQLKVIHESPRESESGLIESYGDCGIGKAGISMDGRTVAIVTGCMPNPESYEQFTDGREPPEDDDEFCYFIYHIYNLDRETGAHSLRRTIKVNTTDDDQFTEFFEVTPWVSPCGEFLIEMNSLYDTHCHLSIYETATGCLCYHQEMETSLMDIEAVFQPDGSLLIWCSSEQGEEIAQVFTTPLLNVRIVTQEN